MNGWQEIPAARFQQQNIEGCYCNTLAPGMVPSAMLQLVEVLIWDQSSLCVHILPEDTCWGSWCVLTSHAFCFLFVSTFHHLLSLVSSPFAHILLLYLFCSCGRPSLSFCLTNKPYTAPSNDLISILQNNFVPPVLAAGMLLPLKWRSREPETLYQLIAELRNM